MLVSYDLLGLNPHFKPKFVKHYATLGESVKEAAGSYFDEVRSGSFPDEAHSFHTMRLVPEQREEKTAVYSVPV